MDNEFRTDNKQTTEEFLAQFNDESEEIIVKVQWAWTKGSSRFNTFGNLELAHMNYMQPWEADSEHPFGIGGTVYWMVKRKVLGYPYPPHFLQNICYRLRVRRCRNGRNFFLLEEVLESNVDVALSSAVYDRAYERYMNRFTGETKEVLIYCVNDVNAGKVKRAEGMAIGYAYLDYSAIIDDEPGIPKMVGSCMAIPVDDKKFSGNKLLRFKAGHIYRVRVNIPKENPSGYAFDRLIESDVTNDKLTAAGVEAQKTVKWNVEGFGDFDIYWDKIEMMASREDIRWDPSDEKSQVSIYLLCDRDNCHTAYKTTEAFLRLYKDRQAFEKKIFAAVADDLSNDEDMVETWDEEAGTIPKEELIRRIRISFLSFDAEGVDIMIDLDDLFTDHGYSLYMDSEGEITVTGLWG